MSFKSVDINSLKTLANQFRCEILELLSKTGSGHPGGSLSGVEIMISLYSYKMKYKADDPHWEDRDRLVISKGHASALAYVTLANYGFFPKEELNTYRKLNSRLQG